MLVFSQMFFFFAFSDNNYNKKVDQGSAEEHFAEFYNFYFNRKLSIHILESFSINIFFLLTNYKFLEIKYTKVVNRILQWKLIILKELEKNLERERASLII